MGLWDSTDAGRAQRRHSAEYLLAFIERMHLVNFLCSGLIYWESWCAAEDLLEEVVLGSSQSIPVLTVHTGSALILQLHGGADLILGCIFVRSQGVELLVHSIPGEITKGEAHQRVYAVVRLVLMYHLLVEGVCS